MERFKGEWGTLGRRGFSSWRVTKYSLLRQDCNEELPNAAQIPAPLVDAVPTVAVSTQSGIAKAMTALAGACMVIIFLLSLMFLHKRDAPPIRAASRLFSNLILLGGEITLASVILRTSVEDSLGWPQCFGTCKFQMTY